MIELSFGGYINSLGHYSIVKITGDNIEQVLRESIEARNYLRKAKELLKTSGTRGETGSLNLGLAHEK
jgi:hypothetical protein